MAVDACIQESSEIDFRENNAKYCNNLRTLRRNIMQNENTFNFLCDLQKFEGKLLKKYITNSFHFNFLSTI